MIKNLLLIPYQMRWPHWHLEMMTELDYKESNLYLQIKFLAFYLRKKSTLVFQEIKKKPNVWRFVQLHVSSKDCQHLCAGSSCWGWPERMGYSLT